MQKAIEILQDQVVKKQALEAEQVTEEDVIAALNVLNFIAYKQTADIFLGCAAANLLHTYARQTKTQLSYEFKRHLMPILQKIEELQGENIEAGIEVIYDNSDKRRILMFQIYGFQFSFQNEPMTKIIAKTMTAKEVPWDGIRKQLCATTIFHYALNYEGITNETMKGQKLIALLEEELAYFHQGRYTFENGRLIKHNIVRQIENNEDSYLKNYMRIRLCDCQDRPVILIGTFKRIWNHHVTFVKIRPYIKGIQTIIICDHINISLPELTRYIDVNTLKKNKTYYIIGFCEKYKNSERMGVRLAENLEHAPIIALENIRKISRDVFADCTRFSIEEYLRDGKKKKIKL